MIKYHLPYFGTIYLYWYLLFFREDTPTNADILLAQMQYLIFAIYCLQNPVIIVIYPL